MANLHSYVSQLRRTVAPDLVTEPHGYRLPFARDRLDLLIFEDRLRAARAAEADDMMTVAEQHYRSAFTLWRGEPAEDGGLTDTMTARLAELAEWAAAARADWTDLRLRLGHHTELIGELRVAVKAQPLRERNWQHLMLALHGSGRKAEALDAYRHARDILVEELGVEPGPQLHDLHQAILNEHPGHHTARPESVPPRPPAPAQLPMDVRGFVGREAEFARLDELAAESRAEPGTVGLATLTGTAGVGKTALALRWAHRSRSDFPDGQLYVDLRGFDPRREPMSPDEAVRGFLDALDVPSDSIPASLDGQIALYRRVVAALKLLIVLDNAADADQVRPLLPGTGGFVIVTSRRQMPSLVVLENAVPIVIGELSQDGSRELLQRRLGHAALRDESAAVEQIITACAGLPLALALVAARAALRPAAPLSGIVKDLATAGRLAALSAGTPDLDLRAVFSWSYQQLTPAASGLFRALGLHPVPTTSIAVAATLAGISSAEAGAAITELVQANLLTEAGDGRYVLHDLLHAYASQLAQDDDIRQTALSRLFDHYLATAHAAVRLTASRCLVFDPPPPGPAVTMTPLETDGEARQWYAAERPALVALVLGEPADDLDERRWMLATVVHALVVDRGVWHESVAVQQAGLAAAERVGSERGQALTHLALGSAHGRTGNPAAADLHIRRSMEIFGRRDLHAGLARGHERLGDMLAGQKRWAEAMTHVRLSAQHYRADDDLPGTARSLNNLGWLQAQLGQTADAMDACREALRLHRRAADRRGEAYALHTLSYIYQRLGDQHRAIRCIERCIPLLEQLQLTNELALIFNDLAEAQEAAGMPSAATETRRRAEEFRQKTEKPALAE